MSLVELVKQENDIRVDDFAVSMKSLLAAQVDSGEYKTHTLFQMLAVVMRNFTDMTESAVSGDADPLHMEAMAAELATSAMYISDIYAAWKNG